MRLSPVRPLESGLGEPRRSDRARVVQLCLEDRDLRVEHGEKAFARDGEDSIAALNPELLDKDLAAGACRHGEAL